GTTVTGTINDGVIYASPSDAKVYEDGLVNDIKPIDVANPLVSGEENPNITSNTQSLNLTNNNGDIYSVTFDSIGLPTGLTSEGLAVTTSIDAVSGDIVGKLADDTPVFTVVFDQAQATEYTFTLYQPLDHVSGNGHNSFDLTFAYKVSSHSLSTDASFNVTIVDSAPDSDGATLTVLEDSVKANATNQFVLADEFRAGDGVSSLSIAGQNLTVAGQVFIDGSGNSVAENAAGHIGTIESDGAGGISFQPVTDYSGTVTVSYSVTDADGDTATSTLTFDTLPVVDFVAATLSNLQVNEDVRSEDEVEDTTPEALVLIIPDYEAMLATETGNNRDDDHSETMGAITISGIPTGAVLNVNGVDVNSSTGSYTLTDNSHAVTIIPPPDSDVDFTLTYNFTVTDTTTISTGPSISTKDISVAQNIVVHGVADNTSIDASLNDVTIAEQSLTDIAGSWMNVADIINTSDLTFGDSADGSEAHLIRIDGLSPAAFYSTQATSEIGIALVANAGNSTNRMFLGNDSDYYQVINNGGSTSSLIMSADKFLDGADLEAKLRFPDVDGVLSITVTAIAVEKEFVDAEGADWYDSVAWDAYDGNTDGGSHTSDVIGYEVSDANMSTITITKSIDVLVSGVTTAEDTSVAFLTGLTITDLSDEVFTEIKILNSSLNGAVITVDAPASVTTGATYTTLDNLTVLANYKITPPAHSSADLTLELEITTTDGSGTYNLPITVTPVAEVISTPTSDTDGNSSADLAMNGDHTYSQNASEDGDADDDPLTDPVWFDLGVDSGFNLATDWENEDDSTNIGNETHTTSAKDSEETFAHLTFTIDVDDGNGFVEESGAQYKYNDGSNDIIVTDTGAGVDIPVAYLASLAIIAPAELSGAVRIKVEAKTVDYDEDTDASVESTSGEAVLSFTIDWRPKVPQTRHRQGSEG
ncbi:MAG: cadherin-like domain-containing protein, partial [Gammaproteobacteria bacterium]|nr:cadherin-like domain-containing protein [Gammaproteobacteria bacterium]